MKLRERTEDREQEHVDERAYKFFSYGYSGKYKYHWKSTSEGLRPTAVLEHGHFYPVCAYCGRQALPIQGERKNHSYMGSTSYYDKGHCCVCKDAMDELECKDKATEIREKMNRLLVELNNAKPKINPDVVEAMIQERAARDLKELNREKECGWGIHHQLDGLGIKLKKENNREEEYYDE